MEFLGVGPFELLLIVVVALVVVGPERLPVLARQAGKMLVTVRDWVQKSPDAAMILRARQEIESELANIRESLAEVQNARDEVVNAARQVTTMVQDDVIGSTRAAIDEVKNGTVARPTKPNGMPVDLGETPSSLALDNVAEVAEIHDTEPTLIAPDGTTLLEIEPAPETATIAPPRDNVIAPPRDNVIGPQAPNFSALQAQITALTEELRGLQMQLQERGVIASALPNSNGNGVHAEPEPSNTVPALIVPTIEEHEDVDQPAYSRD